MPVIDRIQLRRDTAANWTSANPTLAAGEPGYETDTGFVKIGDGSTAWTALDYLTSDYAPLVSPTFVDSIEVSTTPVYGNAESPRRSLTTTPVLVSGDFNLGYKFTVNTDGRITHLAFYSADTASHTLRLYSMAGTVLASATVTGVGGNVWQSVAITPVLVTSGTSYVVAYRTGTGGSLFHYATYALPTTAGNITINEGRYLGGSDAIPTTVGDLYFADVTFETPTLPSPINAPMPPYASNAAALAAGLVVGDFYRNGDNVCVVH